MSQELHYTSVPRGLKPGSRGFCTVGQTPHMPGPLVDRLEALSGYQPVFPPHDPSAPLNPIVFSHLRLTVSGNVVSVLSRIGPAGLDYSGRPNKYAHHVVLEGTERSEAGPAWLLSQPGFMQGAWEGEPREIPAGRTQPQGDHQPGVAHAWRSLIGDGGWAGVLAETFLADPRRTVFLVFRPGMDLLPLFVEALALLPFSRRWEVDFSTYFSPLPQGITCAWRGVLDGSDEAKNARRLPNAVFFDLCHLLGRAEGGALVHLARTGERLAQESGPTTSLPESGGHIPRMPHEPATPHAIPSDQAASPRPRTTNASYDLLPELARLVPAAGAEAHHDEPSLSRQRRRIPWGLLLAIFAACLILLSVAGFLVSIGTISPKMGPASELIAEVVEQSDEVKKTAELAKKEGDLRARQPNNVEEPISDGPPIEKGARTQPVPPPQVTTPRKPPPIPRTVDTGATPAILPNRKHGPLILFMELPATPGRQSQLPSIKGTARADTGNVDSSYSPFQKQYVRFSDALNVNIFEKPIPGQTLKIETKSISFTAGKVSVATMKLLDRKSFSFRWENALAQSSQNDELSSATRDIVLMLKSVGGDEDYLVLRDPKPRNTILPFDLKNEYGRQLDRFQKRSRVFTWADDENALVKTKWTLGIRRWRIVNRLAKDGPERIIAAGDRGTGEVKEAIEEIINHGDAKLSIRIGHDKRHCIQVGLQFDTGRIMDHNAKKDRLFRDYEINLTKPSQNQRGHQKKRREEEPLSPLEIHDTLKKIEENLRGDLQEFNKIKISMADLEELRRIVSKEILYNFMNRSEISDLSLVVGLKLDNGTVLEIARIGTFADSHL